MYKMAELFTQVEELLENDYISSEIAVMLNIDIDMVYDVMESFFTPKKEILPTLLLKTTTHHD